MEDQTLYWIWLSLRNRLGAGGQKALLEVFGGPAAIWGASEEDLVRAGVRSAARKALLDKDLGPARAILDRCAGADVAVVTWADAAFPPRLRAVADGPILLYYRGTLPGEDRPLIGLVGSRTADEAGLALAHRFGAELAACGGLVVTGLAKGIDTQGALGALAAGGSVVGVLGCGPDLVYPAENRGLFARTAEQGCLISEYPPGTAPNARHFPVRNRLISGLSDGVLVVRATENSGSLITARWAAAQGRDVYAVPGDPADPQSRGCNALLRDGAQAAATGWEVLERYQFRYPGTVRRQEPVCKAEPAEFEKSLPLGGKAAAPKAVTDEAASRQPDLSVLSPLQQQIVTALQAGPLQVDALIDRTGLPAAQVLPQLTVLQIKQVIRQKPGKIYEIA